MTTAAAPRLAYQPALDGVRAVAVVMVLLFHGGVGWMHGGYVGVSVFFTLSGFLITSLLVREHEDTDRIDPGGFYARRAKRLLPASSVCIAAVVVLGAYDVWRGAGHLRRDALGGLFQVANWVALGSGDSYTDIQARSAGLMSPLEHYWSLAIEEQFYWVWPLAFWAIARSARRRQRGLTGRMVAITLVCAAAAPATALVWGKDAAYWATPARAAEIMVGALLAVALHERRVRPAAWMAPAGGAVVAAVAVTAPATGGPLFHGAFPAFSLASACLLLGLQRPGRAAAMLGWAPFAAIGRISYGIYVFHLPAFLLLSEERVGVGGPGLLAIRLAATGAAAVLSAWAIEQPIRRARWELGRTATWAAAAVLLVAATIVIAPQRSATYYAADRDDIAAAAIPEGQPVAPLGTVAPATTPPASGAGTSRPTTTAPPGLDAGRPGQPAEIPIPVLGRPVRILVVGDSTAEATGAGLVAWAADHPTAAVVTVLSAGLCGFVRGGLGTSVYSAAPGPCNDLLDRQLPDALRDLHPDVVMLMSTLGDSFPRAFDGSSTMLTPLDPEFLDRARTDYAAITDLILTASTAQVAWTRPPTVDPYWTADDEQLDDPALLDALGEVAASTIARDPARVGIVDLRAWFEHAGIVDDHTVRPDGFHVDPAASLGIATRWLGPVLMLEATR